MDRRAIAAAALTTLISLTAFSHAAAPSVSVVAPLDPSIGQLPESITTDDAGNIYLSMSTSVWKLAAGQTTPTVFATLPIPQDGITFALGLKFGPDGALYAGSGSFNPADDAAHVWRIASDGSVSSYVDLDPSGFPNDLAWDDDGNLFVTDPFLGRVYKIDEQRNIDVWIDDPLLDGNGSVFGIASFGADGIAFDNNKKNLYLTNLDYGEIIRVPVKKDGSAGDPTVFAGDASLIGADGISFDKNGNLYVAVNAQNQIAVVDKDGDVSVVAQGGPLDGPSSLVFGTHGNEKKTLYISSFAIGAALSGGVPHPALLEMEVKHGGLALP